MRTHQFHIAVCHRMGMDSASEQPCLEKCLEEKEQPHLICRASGQDELAVGVEGQTVDLCSVSVHCMAGLRGIIGPRVPALHTTERKCWDGKKQTKKQANRFCAAELLTS